MCKWVNNTWKIQATVARLVIGDPWKINIKKIQTTVMQSDVWKRPDLKGVGFLFFLNLHILNSEYRTSTTRIFFSISF